MRKKSLLKVSDLPISGRPPGPVLREVGAIRSRPSVKIVDARVIVEVVALLQVADG